MIAVQAHEAPAAARRARSADRRRATSPAARSRPGYRDWLTAEGFTADTFDFAIDVTDGGLDNGVRRRPPTPTSQRARRLREPTTRRLQTRATAAATAPTSRRSPPAQGRARRGGRGRRGFDYGLGVAPFARIGVVEDLRLQPATAAPTLRSRRRVDLRRLRAGARDLEQLVGHPTRRRLHGARSAVRRARARRAARGPGQPADGRGLRGRQRRHGTDTPRLARHGEERDHRRGVRERPARPGRDGCGVTDAEADSARDIADFSSRGRPTTGASSRTSSRRAPTSTGAAPQHGRLHGSGTCDRSSSAGTTFYSLVSRHLAGRAARRRRRGARARLVPAQSQRHRSPSPALTKALLVNTATDLARRPRRQGRPIAAGPNDDQGWGRVNLGNVLDGTAPRLPRPGRHPDRARRPAPRGATRSPTRRSR